jgi:hypothetical protein
MLFEPITLDTTYIAVIRREFVGGGHELCAVTMVDHGRTYIVDMTYENMRDLKRGDIAQVRLGDGPLALVRVQPLRYEKPVPGSGAYVTTIDLVATAEAGHEGVHFPAGAWLSDVYELPPIDGHVRQWTAFVHRDGHRAKVTLSQHQFAPPSAPR